MGRIRDVVYRTSFGPPRINRNRKLSPVTELITSYSMAAETCHYRPLFSRERSIVRRKLIIISAHTHRRSLNPGFDARLANRPFL